MRALPAIQGKAIGRVEKQDTGEAGWRIIREGFHHPLGVWMLVIEGAKDAIPSPGIRKSGIACQIDDEHDCLLI